MLWSLLFISLITLCNAKERTELNGSTSQSTVYENKGVRYSAERAIDGNQSTCAHTLPEKQSWWRIDLLGVYRISSISIYNKQHYNADINGALIYIGNSREKNGTTNYMSKNITKFKPNNWNRFTFERNVSGRYITVCPQEDKDFILCEVKIFGSKKESRFQLVKESKTWEDALNHCRCQNMDLASIVNEETQAWAELEAKNANTPFVWLGLRYTCALNFWFWVDDQRLTFNRWDQNSETGKCDMSGAMDKEEDHLWFIKSDNREYNFICANY